MAITSAQARVWHIASISLSRRLSRLMGGRTLMHKTSLFAVAATLIVAGVGVWVASTTTTARVAAPSIGQAVEPFKLMMNAKEMPSMEFVDYTFVFN